MAAWWLRTACASFNHRSDDTRSWVFDEREESADGGRSAPATDSDLSAVVPCACQSSRSDSRLSR